jgi:hypothetical protein
MITIPPEHNLNLAVGDTVKTRDGMLHNIIILIFRASFLRFDQFARTNNDIVSWRKIAIYKSEDSADTIGILFEGLFDTK